MPTSGFSRTAWEESTHVTRETYVKEVIKSVKRKRLIMALLQRRGKFKHGQGGDSLTWVLEKKQTQPRQLGDGGPIAFSRKTLHKQATIDFRQYTDNDMLSWVNEMQNTGVDALVKLTAQKLKQLAESMRSFLNSQLFVDGYATGNEQSIHGLESFLGTGTTVAGDIIAKPSDTYATISTAIASEGGNWSADLATSPNASLATDWPFGTPSGHHSSTHYDFFSPKIWNHTSSGWGTGSTTWDDNCLQVLRNAITVQRDLNGEEGKTDIFLCKSDMLIALKDTLESRFRMATPHKEAQNLGFESTVNYEGVAVDTDIHVPSATGYGLSLDRMEFITQTSDLFESMGPKFEMTYMAYLFLCAFLGNVKYESPKYFWATKAVA